MTQGRFFNSKSNNPGDATKFSHIFLNNDFGENKSQQYLLMQVYNTECENKINYITQFYKYLYSYNISNDTKQL